MRTALLFFTILSQGVGIIGAWHAALRQLFLALDHDFALLVSEPLWGGELGDQGWIIGNDQHLGPGLLDAAQLGAGVIALCQKPIQVQV